MELILCVCGHSHLNQFDKHDLASWHHDMARLSGVRFSGWVA